MDSHGCVWTRMGPYGPWGLPGGFLGPPGALGGPERGVKGGSPPGGARGALLGGLPISLRGILTYMPFRAAYEMYGGEVVGRSGCGGWEVRGGGVPLASLCPTWDPHLYARLGLPRRPDYSTRGSEDYNAGPEDLSIRLNTKT